MDENSSNSTSRGSLMKKGAALLAGVVIVPVLDTCGKAFAVDKLKKESVKYQDKAKEGKDCDDCIRFIPGKTIKDMGACKVVAGAISPHGYCLAFTTKPKHG
jgi:hypothetical protein